MATTYHLALADEWSSGSDRETYAPAAYEREGFIHCTDGADEMVATANRHYLGHPGPFVVVEVDLSGLDAPVVYEDERRIYPHVYGRLPRASIVRVLEIVRAADGTFLSIGDPTGPS